MSFLTLKNISKSFGKINALNSIDFKCDKGEQLGIVGESGSGKSVLLKIIADIFKPDSGEILWADGSTPSIGFLFQEGALFDSMSVRENVLFPLKKASLLKSEIKNLSEKELNEKVIEMLGFVGLSKAIDKYPSELSGGMRKRAGIARALIHAPELLLLDDPTSGLDPVTANTIMNLIERLTQERNCTTIIVSHDIRRLMPRVARVCMMEEGKIIADIKTSEILNSAPSTMINFLKTRYDFTNV